MTLGHTIMRSSHIQCISVSQLSADLVASAKVLDSPLIVTLCVEGLDNDRECAVLTRVLCMMPIALHALARELARPHVSDTSTNISRNLTAFSVSPFLQSRCDTYS